MSSTKKLLSGAAIGTLIGALSTILYPRRNEILEILRDRTQDFSDLTEKAKEYGGSLLNKGKQLSFKRVEYKNNYWKGGLIGLILGAGSALLLAPKSGKNLRGQLTRVYNDISEKSEELIHQFKKNSSHPLSRAETHHNGVKKKKPLIKSKRKEEG